MRFRTVYPPNEALLLDGGLNNKYQRALIADNESPSCQNVVFDQGAVETRYGSEKFNTSSVGSFACDGLYTRYTRTGDQTMVAAFNGSIFTWNVNTFVSIPSAQSVFTAGVRIAASQQENHLFMGTGETIPHKWNGTDFTRHGVYPPTTAPVAATAPTGTVLTGDYQWKVTYVNSQSVEGDVSISTSTLTVAGQNAILTSIPVAPQSWGVSARRIYRNTNAAPTTFKRVAEISDNTTTTYEDGVADASLGVTAPTDNGVPPSYQGIVSHQNRLWMVTGTDNKLYYTELGEPFTVASTNFRQLGDDAGVLPKTVAVHNDMILVTCSHNKSFLIYLEDPSDDSTWQDITIDGYGGISPFGISNFENKTMVPVIENDKFVGFAVFKGIGVERSATFLTVATAGARLASDRIEPDMFQIQEAYLKNISSIVYKNKVWNSVTYGSGATTNNRIYVYDFDIDIISKRQRDSWVPFTGTPMHIAQFTIYNGSLYGGTSDASGFVYKLDNGTYSDAGSAIDSFYWTKELSGYQKDFNFHKDFRDLFIYAQKPGDYNMNITYRVDSDNGSGSTEEIDLNPGGSLWGSMVWGVDSWGGGSADGEFRVNLATARGKRLQIRFSNQNTVNQKFRVSRMNFTYNLKGLR